MFSLRTLASKPVPGGHFVSQPPGLAFKGSNGTWDRLRPLWTHSFTSVIPSARRPLVRNCGVKQSASGWPPSNSLCAQTQPNQDRPRVDRGQSHPTTASGTRPCLRRASGQPLHTHCTCLDAPATGAFPTPTTGASRFLIEKVSRQPFSSARPAPLTGPRPVMSESLSVFPTSRIGLAAALPCEGCRGGYRPITKCVPEPLSPSVINLVLAAIMASTDHRRNAETRCPEHYRVW